VNTDLHSAVAQARKDLGARLRQLRKSAGLTGQALADATGQHFTRVSRIENGVQPPTERNIRDWCTVCGCPDQIPDLLAAAQSVETAYLEWARQSRAGMKHLGDLSADVAGPAGAIRARRTEVWVRRIRECRCRGGTELPVRSSDAPQ
jgi:transcriptional regulator with XRE-family HTH domain